MNFQLSTGRRHVIVDIISILFILLFLYAAVSKLIKFDDFNTALRKSPMLVDISFFVSLFIPAIEIIVVALLYFDKTKLIGLYGSFSLMTLFTFYIVAILGFSEYIPCTCGGILQEMNWSQHLVFNVIFLLASVAGIFLLTKKIRHQIFVVMTSVIVITGITVSTLFALTYDDVNKYSSFNRIFSEMKVKNPIVMPLKYKGYYFAGVNKNGVYIANDFAPLDFLLVKNSFKDSSHIRITVLDDLNFNKPTVRVLNENFFLINGVTPRILSGNTQDWKAHRLAVDSAYFNESIPVGPNSFALRVINSSTSEYSLGKLELGLRFSMKPDLLKKQIDGRFCVDGKLQYNTKLNKIIYTYSYRNQFIVMDTTLKLEYYGRTIDSISHAKIKFTKLNGRDDYSLSGLPLIVNKFSATSADMLYILSNIRAKNETEEDFSKSSCVDVYNLLNRQYVHSFYLPLQLKSIRDFLVDDDSVIVLSDNQVIKFDITDIQKRIAAAN